jgi:predicted nuclease of predicted toxin-antitoxin system
VLRLWLDGHLSPALARGLRERGYDVVALQEEARFLRGLPDDLLLAEAAHRGRAIVTYNARDFAPLHRVFLAGGRSHAGIVLISSQAIRQDDIGGQSQALTAFLDEHAGETEIRDRLVWVRPVRRQE